MPVQVARRRRRLWPFALAVAVAAAVLLLAAGGAGAKTIWLCKPGLKSNPCDLSTAATVEREDGSTYTVPAARVTKLKVDCFYLYPTVSGEPGALADRKITGEQTAIAEQQASRFHDVCRVYAPMYRQLTIGGINGAPAATPAQSAAGPADVRAAFLDYLKHDNHGRGIVFVGHSQGAFLLETLIHRLVDTKPKLRRQLVSAVLLGGNVHVPKGRDVGGTFARIPACRRTGQTACVIAYSTFDATPPADAVFGRVGGFGSTGGHDAGLKVLCTNPARLAGGAGTLKPYLRTVPFPGVLGLAIGLVPQAPTPWFGTTGQYTARCMDDGNAQWLNVSHRAGDPRPVFTSTVLPPTWGLHLGDVNLAWGNLVDDVRAQAKAYLARR